METCSTVAWADNFNGSKIALMIWAFYYYRIFANVQYYVTKAINRFESDESLQ